MVINLGLGFSLRGEFNKFSMASEGIGIDGEERGGGLLDLVDEDEDEVEESGSEPGARHHQVGVFMGQAAQLTCRGF